jgi:uncharacterized membrane protein YgcG
MSRSIVVSESVSVSLSLTQSFSVSISDSRSIPITESGSSSVSPTGDAATPSTPVTDSLSVSGATATASAPITASTSLPETQSLTLSDSASVTLTESLSGSETFSDVLPSEFEKQNNLLYSPRYANYSAKRFLRSRTVPSATNYHLSWRVANYRTDTQLSLYRTLEQTAHATVAVGGTECAELERFGLPGSKPAVRPPPVCGAAALCDLARPDHHVGEHIFGITAAPPYSAAAQCNSPSSFAGVVAIDGTFADVASYFIVQLNDQSAGNFPSETMVANGQLQDPGATYPATVAFRGYQAYAAGVSLTRLRRAEADRTRPIPLAPQITTTVTEDPAVSSLATGETVVLPPLIPGTASATLCELRDITAYTLRHSAIGIGSTAACQVTVDGARRACKTLDEYQRACDELPGCTGFTARLVAPVDEPLSAQIQFNEEGITLFTDHPGYRALTAAQMSEFGATTRGVIFYERVVREARRCSFPTQDAASVAIFVAQTSYSTSYVQVYLKPFATSGTRVLVKQCGGIQSFDATATESGTSSYFGADEDCGTYALCYESPLLEPGMVIEVEAASTVSQASCPYSLSVLAEAHASPVCPFNRTVDDLFGNQLYIPVDVSSFTGRDLYVAPTSQDSVQITVYVHNASLATLRVLQTAYSCHEEGRPCTAPSVLFGYRPLGSTAAVLAATCGGSEPFANGEGLSGQCELGYDCSANVTVFPGVFTGLLTVTVDSTFIGAVAQTFTLPDSCTSFTATVYASSGNNASTLEVAGVPVFPLGAAGESLPLLAFDSSEPAVSGYSATEFARFILVGNATGTEAEVAVPSATELFEFGDVSRVLAGHYVDWSLLPDRRTTMGQTMFPNVSFFCIADTVTAAQHTCYVPIPTESNYASVEVAQSDFAGNTIAVDFLDADGVPVTDLSTTCGAQYGFLGFAGKRSECNQYLRCVDSFIDSTTRETPRVMRLTVANTLTASGCDFALGAVIDFSRRPYESSEGCDGYYCQSNRRCISADRVCDGLAGDCSNLADERQCHDFLYVEVGVTLDATPLHSDFVSSLAACRRLTVRRSGAGFTSSEATEKGVKKFRCDVWSQSDVAVLLPAPTSRLVRAEDENSRLYLQLSESSAYGRCSAILHCNEHGTLRNAATLQDGDKCVCECDIEYTGDSCSVLKSMGKAVTYVAIVRRTQNVLSAAAYEDALAAGDRSISLSVGQYLPFNDTHQALPFTFSSFDAAAAQQFGQDLFSPSSLAPINRRLSQLSQIPVSVIFGMDGLNSFFPVASCAVTVDGTGFTCSATRTYEVSSLRLSVFGVANFAVSASTSSAPFAPLSNGADDFADLALDAVETPNAPTTEFGGLTCTGTRVADTRTNSRASCFQSNCVLNFDGDVKDITIAAIPGYTSAPATTSAVELPDDNATDDDGTDVTASDSGSAADDGNVTQSVVVTGCEATALVAVDGTTRITLADIRNGQDPVISQLLTNDFMFGAIGGISAMLITVGVLGFSGYKLHKFVKEARSQTASSSLFAYVPKWSANALAEERFMLFRSFDIESVMVAFAFGSVVIAGVMGLLWVLFVTSTVTDSNFDAVLAFYQSSICGADTAQIRTLPYQLGAIRATSECSALQFVGESEGTLFARATCVDEAGNTATAVGTNVVARVSLGTVMGQCINAHDFTIRRDECVAVSSLLPGRAGYIQADCVDASVTPTYLANLQALNPTVPQSLSVRPDDPPSGLGLSVFGGADGATVYAWPFVSQSTYDHSTSHEPNTVATIYSSEYYTGDFHLKRTVMQLPGVFQTADIANRTALDNLENDLRNDQRRLNLATLRSYVPKIDDYPVGFIFSSYGTVNEVTGENAGATAQRYLNMKDTVFDLGAVFNDATVDPLDGFTIGFWMRASNTTNGFVFALTDFYEDASQQSPILNKLFGLVEEGPGTTRPWFDRSFHVYGALFANGAKSSLTFAMASPYEDGLGDTSVTIVEWQLDTAGNEFIFNDQWHYVSLSLANENSKPYIVLGIDGFTLLSDQQYRKCLTRAPVPIRNAAEVFVESDAINANILRGGVLYVGYFNGGVQGLTFTSKHLPIESSVRHGTREIRVDQAKPVTSFMTIFWALVICAVIALATMIVQTRALRKSLARASETAAAEVRRKYEGRLRTLFGPYPALPYDVVADTFEVGTNTFAAMMKELFISPLDNSDDPNTNKLPRALYLAKHPHLVENELKEPLPPMELQAKAPTIDVYTAWLAELGIVPYTDDEVSAMEAAFAAQEDDRKAAAAGGKGETKDAKGGGGEKKSGGGDKGGGSGGDASGGSGGGDASSSSASMNAVLLSVLGTIQAASIYTSTWTLPDVYLGNIVPVLQVVSLDFFDSIFDNPLAAPLFQLGFAIVVIGGVAFAFIKDDKKFYRNALRYQQRRDRIENHNRALSEKALNFLLSRVDPAFLLEKLFPTIHAIKLMLPNERAELQLFEDDKEQTETELHTRHGVLIVTKCEGLVEYTDDDKTDSDTDEKDKEAENEAAEDHEADGDDNKASARPHTPREQDEDDEADTKLSDTEEKKAEPTHNVRQEGNEIVIESRLLARLRKVRLAEEDVMKVEFKDDVAPVSGVNSAAASPAEHTALRTAMSFTGAPQLLRRQQSNGLAHIKRIGVRCPEHHDETLLPTVQSSIVPYRNRRTCCVIDGGKRCGRFEGVMYVCSHVASEVGIPILRIVQGDEDCSYAVCEQHLRPTPVEQIKLALRASLNKFLGRGGAWLFYYIVITIALALYTPVMRTCLMLLSCHPLYQCEFPLCWSSIDQKFAAAVYLSALMAVMFGLGFPVAFFYILNDRYQVLHEIFAGTAYEGKYMEPLESAETDAADAGPRIATSVSALCLAVLSTFTESPFAELGRRITANVRGWLALRFAHLPAEPKTLSDAGANPSRHSGAVTFAGVDFKPIEGPPTTLPEDAASSGAKKKDASRRASRSAWSLAETEKMDNASDQWENDNAGTSEPEPRNPFLPLGPVDPQQDSPRPGAIEEQKPADVVSPIEVGFSRATRNLCEMEDSLPEVMSETVSTSEWMRFLLSDPSALAPLYEQVNFESMRFVPVLHAAKFALLIPPLLLEPNSIVQIAFIAAGEVSYAIVLAVMAPYLTIWMSLITLAGNMHQFLLVGLQAYFAAHANDKDLSESVGEGMLAISLTYVIVIFLMLGIMTLGPVLSQVYAGMKVAKIFRRFGMSQPLAASLYISPFVGAVESRPNRVTLADVGGDMDASELLLAATTSGLSLPPTTADAPKKTKEEEEAEIAAELRAYYQERHKENERGRGRMHTANKSAITAQRLLDAQLRHGAAVVAAEAAAKPDTPKDPREGIEIEDL